MDFYVTIEVKHRLNDPAIVRTYAIVDNEAEAVAWVGQCQSHYARQGFGMRWVISMPRGASYDGWMPAPAKE